MGKPDLASDQAALLTLRSAVGGKTTRWNLKNQSDPCTWQGVICEKRRVTVLRLPADELIGVIPEGIFGNLTKLRTLSLRVNALTGQLPSDLGQCTELRNLYLQDNKFSGKIPAFLFEMQNLVRLNLAGNHFSGEISSEFNNLTRLGTLFLENNQLTGEIPVLNLTSLVQFNVSFNRLNGSIPSTLRSMKSASFVGNLLCGGPLGLCPGESNNITTGDGNGNGNGKCSRKTRAVDVTSVKHPSEVEKPLGDIDGNERNLNSGYQLSAIPVATQPAVKPDINNAGNRKLLFFGNASRFFDLEDLLRASAEVLGKGTFGTAYKAVLEVGTVVAVKRLKDVTIPEKEFREKIEIVGSMDHESLVPLRAYYYSSDEKLLVYDYMENGSLSALLHGNRGAGRTPLNWQTRSSIALGAARGIEYLHSRGSTVSHGNIKSSNVLLTKSNDARVSDFGLAQLVGPTSTPNRVAGYRAPEVTDVRKVSQKADVYSFGVLLLELLTDDRSL
ncbi:hypothetical protein IFM89_039733 [Coptis chinensis]|uniref:Protein kinase domain-containing protein n=1 Tax=Coptis chinensis TaxID=261450 RepID=A0A835LC41_9MAGN|nr:hypothetical protein IFM89_039733 [Coptis chinensis]